MEINYLSYLFLLLAGMSNGVMDLLAYRYYASVFEKKKFNRYYWHTNYSWANKWKKGNPANGERFRFSSTALVFLTDAWHLFQWIMISFISLAVVFYKGQGSVLTYLIDFVLLRFVFWQLGFWITYESKLLKK